MNLAIIRSECSFNKGGAERYAANLARALAKMGHKVWVLAEKCDSHLHPDIIHIPIRVNRTTSSSRNNSFQQNSQKALEALQPDAVLALSRSFPSDAFRVSDPLHGFWMKIRYPNRLHRFLQSLNPRHRTILNLEKRILDPANTRAIITNSQLSKTIIAQTHSFPPERIHVVYNGVDHDQFSPAESHSSDRRDIELLFVGQDFKRKGLAPLLHALARVRAADLPCRLRVIGRDSPKPYQQLADSLGIAEQVRFEGPSGQLQQAYRDADLFVFPTLYDPFANVCLEALACGLPVVTTTTNGASEIITEGMDGFVVDGGMEVLAERIAEKIRLFCKCEIGKRREMRAAAARKAAKYTIDGNANAVSDLLRQI